MPDPTATAFLLRGDQFEPTTGIPPTDRGFRYGMSVFETIAIHRGKPLFLEAHFERFERSAASFAPDPVWREAAAQLLASPPATEGVIRLYITAGNGFPSDPITAPRILALAETQSLEPGPPTTCRTIAFDPQPLPAVKTGNYWPHIAALQRARLAGADEAILTTREGRMISASMGNVFFITNDTLVTPPLADGPRDGVVRAWISEKFPTAERTITRADLPTLDAAFITNSRVGIREIARIDDRPFPPLPLVARIAATYRSEILRA